MFCEIRNPENSTPPQKLMRHEPVLFKVNSFTGKHLWQTKLPTDIQKAWVFLAAILRKAA